MIGSDVTASQGSKTRSGVLGMQGLFGLFDNPQQHYLYSQNLGNSILM